SCALPFSGATLRAQPHFFFQAEDGIRFFHVTGVQTCALPISRSPARPPPAPPRSPPPSPPPSPAGRRRRLPPPPRPAPPPWPHISEERRVGKECLLT